MHFSQIAADVLSGALIGLSIAIPVGPSCILCIQRCLAGGLAMGLTTGLGISTAHMIYATLALRGSSEIVGFVGGHTDVFKICSVCLLLVLAARALKSAPRSFDYRQVASIGRDGIRFGVTYGSALLLGLTNPMTMLFFLAVIPSMTGIIGGAPEQHDLPYVVLGVTAASFVWWSIVVTVVNFASHLLLDERRFRVVNRASALTLALVGLAFLVPTLKGWVFSPPHGPAVTVQDGLRKSGGPSSDRRYGTLGRTLTASR